MDTLFGISIGVSSLISAINQASEAIESRGTKIVFACANSNSMNITRSDPVFRSALADADHVVADGIGVRLVARLSGKDVGPRIIGQEYFEGLMRQLQDSGRGRVFFFGSSDAVLEKIRTRMTIEYPSLTLCGMISPPFGEWTDSQNRKFIGTINNSRADLLWVGMTAPKQEKWVYQNRRDLHVPVVGSIGAVFDFFAGTVKASPRWVRRLGFEAVFRLAMEPKRLWRRVLVSNVSFVAVGLWREVLRVGQSRRG